MTEKESQADYIGMSTIKSALLDFFRVVFRITDFLLLSIRRHVLLFLSLGLIGILAAWVFLLLKPNYYRSAMIVYANELTRRDYNQIISNLNQLVAGRAYEDLGKELHVSPQYASNLILIQMRDMDGQVLLKDTSTRQGQPFKIEVIFKEIVSPDSLQQGMLTFLNNKTYLNTLKEGERRINEEKLLFIQAEQKRLDSLKTLYNTNLQLNRMPSTFYNNALNPADIYAQSAKLADQKEEIEKWLNIRSVPVILIDGFKTPYTTRQISNRNILIIGFIVGLLAGLVFCILAEIRQHIRKERVQPA